MVRDVVLLMVVLTQFLLSFLGIVLVTLAMLFNKVWFAAIACVLIAIGAIMSLALDSIVEDNTDAQ